MLTASRKLTENEIQNEICQRLEKGDYFFWRQNNGAVFGRNNAGKMTFRSLPKYCRKGVPDIIVLCNGRFIGLEVKREKGKISTEQEKFKSDVLHNGGFYFVVHSVEEVERALIEALI